MASCVWQSISLTLLWTTFFVRIFLHDCMTLQQSGLTVLPVDSCPRNLSEVESATLRLNCSDVKEFRNVYHCLPVSNLSLLVEFCYNRTSGLTGKGNCLVLSNEYINVRQCNHFTRGCPSVPYYYKEMFNYPACIQINKQESCYLADPNCPNISFVERTTMPTVNTNGNSTDLTISTTPTTMPTVYAKGNNTVLTNNPTPLVLGVLAPFVSIVLVILILWTWKRHCSRRRGMTENEDTLAELENTLPLMETEDNEARENTPAEVEETFPLTAIEDNRAREMQTFMEYRWERFQKKLDEASVEVCPISQIIIVGEHGVGKTTLLYRLQGRRREEIEAKRSTRGVECYRKQYSFIITRNQLKMNTKGISSFSADPEQISGICTV